MAKTDVIDKLPSEDDVAKFKILEKLLISMFHEIQELSKKKQDLSLNVLKIRKINQILEQVKEILSNEPTIEFLDLLDEDNLPTNSDAVLILDQYKTSMSIFGNKYYGWDGEEKRWRTKENPDEFEQ